MARSKDLAVECILEAVHLIEAGDPELLASFDTCAAVLGLD